MAPSSPATPTPSDPLVAALTGLLEQQRATHQLLSSIHQRLDELANLVDGFTSGGSSFRAYQVDPMVLVYAAILGPVLSDRLDGQAAAAGDGYIDEMTKGSAVLARKLLRTLDEYRANREGLDYLESEMKGSTLFPGSPPSE
jgi:hypothetical protein